MTKWDKENLKDHRSLKMLKTQREIWDQWELISQRRLWNQKKIDLYIKK